MNRRASESPDHLSDELDRGRSRRDFLASAAAIGLATPAARVIGAGDEQRNAGGIPTRPLGKTGVRVPIIGLGGWDIGAVEEETEAIAIMHRAIEEGVTFFDNCWDYHQGRSEERMGKALGSGGRRDRVFLMTKVCARDRRGARVQLEESLRRLRTDRIDLWQFHGIQWKDDPDLIFDEGAGALRAALDARDQGKIRFIGFTGHKDPDFHLSMLARRFDWDTIQMPVNVLDAHYRSFQTLVLPECTRRGIGAIGMKALGSQNGRIPREVGFTAETCRLYSLSLDIATLVCGIRTRRDLEQDVAIARVFQPLDEGSMRKLVARCLEHAEDGEIERYKTGNFGCDWHHNNPPEKRGG